MWYEKIIRQAKYVQRNTEVRSCNHYCSGKVITITYSERAFVVLVTQHAMRIRHTVTCGVSVSKMFPHYLIKGMISLKSY